MAVFSRLKVTVSALPHGSDGSESGSSLPGPASPETLSATWWLYERGRSSATRRRRRTETAPTIQGEMEEKH